MLGDDIKAAREARGWTQKELASRLRVGLKTINNWESNRTHPKSRLGMLRDVLGVTFDDAEDYPLAAVSELTLLNELSRRAILRDEEARRG